MRAPVILLLLASTAILAASASVQAQEGKPEFSIAISAPESVKAGAPQIILNATVTNITDHPIALDSAGCLEQDFTVDVRNAQGKSPVKTPYMKAITGEDQGPGPQVVIATGSLFVRDLKPGEIWKMSTDLNYLYDHLPPGEYTVTLSRPDYQVSLYRLVWSTMKDNPEHKQPDPSQPNPRPGPLPKAVAKSNTITLTVLP